MSNRKTPIQVVICLILVSANTSLSAFPKAKKLESEALSGNTKAIMALTDAYFHGGIVPGIPKNLRRSFVWGTVYMNLVPDFDRGIERVAIFSEQELFAEGMTTGEHAALLREADNLSKEIKTRVTASDKDSSLSIEVLKPGDVLVADLYQIWFRPNTSHENPSILAQFDLEPEALIMRINGRKEQLSPLRTRPRQGVGETYEETYGNSRVKVGISSKLIKAKSNEFFYSGQMKVTADGRTRTLPVKGYMTN